MSGIGKILLHFEPFVKGVIFFGTKYQIDNIDNDNDFIGFEPGTVGNMNTINEPLSHLRI